MKNGQTKTAERSEGKRWATCLALAMGSLLAGQRLVDVLRAVGRFVLNGAPDACDYDIAAHIDVWSGDDEIAKA